MGIRASLQDFLGSPVVKTASSSAGGCEFDPWWGNKDLNMPPNQNIKQKQYCNKYSKDFKNGPCQKNTK